MNFGIGSIPVETGATAAVRTADFDFTVEVEDVLFEQAVVGAMIEPGTNLDSVARLETDYSTMDVFGDPESDQIWARASEGSGKLVVKCN